MYVFCFLYVAGIFTSFASIYIPFRYQYFAQNSAGKLYQRLVKHSTSLMWLWHSYLELPWNCISPPKRS